MIGATEIILILFVVIPVIFWIITLTDILNNKFEGSNKLIWILVVIFLPIVGSLLYFAIGRRQKIGS